MINIYPILGQKIEPAAHKKSCAFFDQELLWRRAKPNRIHKHVSNFFESGN